MTLHCDPDRKGRSCREKLTFDPAGSTSEAGSSQENPDIWAREGVEVP